MSKVRINDLARELEVKSRQILDVLEEVGVTEKKTHSSSLELDEAERVRARFRRSGTGKASAASRQQAVVDNKPKIDWSQVSKPGDVLKAIQQRAAEQAAAAAAPPRPAAKAVAPPPAPAAPPVATGPVAAAPVATKPAPPPPPASGDGSAAGA